jgi:hypothetical protein
MDGIENENKITGGSGTNTHAQRQQGEHTSLLLFFRNKESRLETMLREHFLPCVGNGIRNTTIKNGFPNTCEDY